MSILSDEKIIKELKQHLKEYFQINDNGEVSPSILWEGGKAVIRGKIIEITSRLKKARLKQQEKLENKIKELELEHKRTSNSSTLLELKKIRHELDELLTYKAEGALRFTNQRYYEMGNRASRLLAFQLRKAQSSRTVPKIRHPNSNRMTAKPTEIAEAFAEYYKNLYSDSESNLTETKTKEFFKKICLPTLTAEEASEMIKPISSQEINDTIKTLKSNKSPGTDGFPGEFYRCFAEEITPVLCRVFNYALSTGNSPGTWSEAIISVLHKEGKDPTLCEGYRPVSLLCNDLKILTSILAQRMQQHITKLIKPDQTGFIPGRQGANNIRRTLNLISCTKNNRQPTMLLSLDAQKAFDRVKWNFLYQTLEVFGFHSTFINWVKIVYKNPKSRIRVNGCCSEFFCLKRGVRQGDCLSPLLFAASIEPLAESIRQNRNIKGIKDEGGLEHKTSLFADDLLTYISEPSTSIPALLDNMKEYGEISGYLTNEAKSIAMMLSGHCPGGLKDKVHFKWTEKGFRYLGIIITPGTPQLFEANYGKLMTEIKNDLARWEILPLNLLGRVEAVRMNILPRLLFLFQSLPIVVSGAFLKKLDKIISRFLWQNKKARVKYKMLLGKKEKGGLNLPNLRNYHWAAQLRALIMWITKEKDSIWVEMEQNSCQKVSLESLPFLNERAWRGLRVGNEWIKGTMKTWSAVRKNLKLSNSVSRATKIAKNPDFVPSVMDSGFVKWADKGLIYIEQILQGQTMKSFTQLQREFNLPSHDFYKFLQLRDYLQKHQEWENIRKTPSKLEETIWSFSEDKSKKGVILKIYKALQHKSEGNNLDVKEKWELEANIIITEEEWEETFKEGHRLTNSPTWREFDWKVKMRYFYTPFITSKYSHTTDLCWRECGTVGDTTHIFWDCPKIQDFWKNIQKEIKLILGIEFPLEPALYILGIIPDNMTDKNFKYLLRILLLIAKKTITGSWLKPQPPSITEWKNRVKNVFIMEKITARLQLKTNLFDSRWLLIRQAMPEL